MRGIGKTTIETLERIALETGVSLWGAIVEAIQRQLLPFRALAALKNFTDIVEDARAMLAGTYAARLEESSAVTEARATEGEPSPAVRQTGSATTNRRRDPLRSDGL